MSGHGVADTVARGRIRRFVSKRPGPWARCPYDGEVYRAPGFFDLTHVETVDGVACDQQGVELAETASISGSEGAR